jgi:hypothetical protein
MERNVQQMWLNELALNVTKNSRATFKVKMIQEFWVSVSIRHVFIV